MRYLKNHELAAIIKDESLSSGEDYLVIDVRDDDFAGGNIVNCRREPSHGFLMRVDNLVSRIKDIPLVVFHCAYSEVRGPKAARVYAETREHMLRDSDPTAPPQEIAILVGGFAQFQAVFKDDPKLVENWDESTWSSEWN